MNYKLLRALCIVLSICLIGFAYLNNDAVKRDRARAESSFIAYCKKECENKDYPECSDKSDVFRNYCIMQNTASCSASCRASARDWRSAEYKLAGSSIIDNIVGGLFITTANILDGILGGFGCMIDGVCQGSVSVWTRKGVDITIFNDMVLKMGLYYVGFSWQYNDILSKLDREYNEKADYGIADYFRIFANIFVVIVFVCLAIRFLSFNFKDSIFLILFSEA